MGQSFGTATRPGDTQISERQPHELLIMLGGTLAVLMSVVLTAIQWAQGPIPTDPLKTVTAVLLINVVLGGTLWIASLLSKKNVMNGAMVAAVVSVILIVFGDKPGLIGGLVGVLGAALGAASPYLPWSRRK